MGSVALLQDFVVVLVVAAVATILAHRIKQPLVLGYLLAGFIIGPFSPPVSLVKNMDSVSALAELGLIFLMFALGLEFNLGKLRKVGKVAIVAAVVEVTLMIAAGYYLGLWMGWSSMDAIYLGAMLSMSSTTIIVKVLTEQGAIHEDYAQITFGILIVEDLLAIVLIAVLGGLSVTGSLSPALLGTVAFSLLLFVGIALAVGLTIVPRLIEFVSRIQMEEVMLITVVGLACANALLAMELGFSLALGAFLMGAIMAESRAVSKVEHKIVPIRDLFTAVFFVAVGMLIDPRILWEMRVPILLITVATVVGKVIAAAAGTFFMGSDGKTSMRIGMSMGQIGEFSFIIAGLGASLGATSDFLYPVAVAVCAITTLLTPYLIHMSGPSVNFLSRYTPEPVQKLGSKWQRLVHSHDATAALATPAPGQRYFAKAVLYAAWVVGLTLAGTMASFAVARAVNGAAPYAADIAFVAGCAASAVIVVPAAASFYRALWRWGRGRATGKILHPRLLARPSKLRGTARLRAHAMALLGLVGLIIFTGLAVVHVHGSEIPDLPWVGAALALITLLAVLDHARIERVCRDLEKIVENLLGEERTPSGGAAAVAAAAPAREDPKVKYPLGMMLRVHRVAADSPASHSTLKALDIRGRTGAHVKGIERGEKFLENPSPAARVQPDDRLHLVGTPQQLDRAMALLEAPSRHPDAAHPDTRQVTLRLQPTSPLIGRRVSHEMLQMSTGIRVVAHHRMDGSPVERSTRASYQPGDRVVVAGPEFAVERASVEMHGSMDVPGHLF